MRLGGEVETKAATHWAFAEGRCAEASVKGKSLGFVGEVSPKVLAGFGVDVPVCGFEIRLPKKKGSS